MYSPDNNTAHVGMPGKPTLSRDTHHNVAVMHSGQMARKSDSPAQNPTVVNMGPILEEAVDEAEAPMMGELRDPNFVKSLRQLVAITPHVRSTLPSQAASQPHGENIAAAATSKFRTSSSLPDAQSLRQAKATAASSMTVHGKKI